MKGHLDRPAVLQCVTKKSLRGVPLPVRVRGPLDLFFGFAIGPHRLEAQDTGFSSLVRGFKSPWGR